MLRAVALALAGLSCAGLSIALASTGCFTAPPADLSVPGLARPTILHDAVVPPTDEIIAQLPPEFIVPVQFGTPDETYSWDVFVDYDPCPGGDCQSPTPPVQYKHDLTASPSILDGGVTIIDFSLNGALDPTTCHRVDFLVAHAFNQTTGAGVPSLHTWDSVGGDIATWFYNAGGGPGGCPVYDAGPLEDGAFPPAEAASDALPIVPESGAGDL
jgi:hypothetical protein